MRNSKYEDEQEQEDEKTKHMHPTSRSERWKHLQKYYEKIPTDKKYIQNKRQEYIQNFRESFQQRPYHSLSIKNDPLCDIRTIDINNSLELKTPSWDSYNSDTILWDTIGKDIQRIRREDDKFFCQNIQGNTQNITHRQVQHRILFLYSKKHIYMQGFHEIAAVQYYIFVSKPDKYATNIHYINSTIDEEIYYISDAEADTFFCQENLLYLTKRLYNRERNEKENIFNTIEETIDILKYIDIKLWDHMCKLQIEPTQYMQRWYTVLLTQEFSIDNCAELWDHMLSHNTPTIFIQYFCVSMVVSHRNTLLNSSFEDCMTFMHHHKWDSELKDLLEYSLRLERIRARSVGCN